MTAAAEPAPVRLLRLPAVIARVGLGRSAWYALISSGQAPQPVRLSARCSAWSSVEIDAWIAARLAARPAAQEARG